MRVQMKDGHRDGSSRAGPSEASLFLSGTLLSWYARDGGGGEVLNCPLSSLFPRRWMGSDGKCE